MSLALSPALEADLSLPFADKTTDWDWSSPALPYWAEESYDVPLTSILA